MRQFIIEANGDVTEISDFDDFTNRYNITDDTKEYHFYGSDSTGMYFFDGDKLIKIAPAVARKLKEQQLTYDNPESEEDKKKRQGRLTRIKNSLSSGELATKLDSDRLFYGSDEGGSLDKYEGVPGSKQELIIQSIMDFVADQIGMGYSYGYGKDSPTRMSDDDIKKVRKRKYEPKDITIALYFDRSASWKGAYKTNFGNDIAASLRTFEEDEDLQMSGVHVKVDIYYFAVHVWPEESMALAEICNSGEPIIQHMIQTQPTNVIIMTDRHMEKPDDKSFWPNHKNTYMKSQYVAPGGVWGIFVNSISNNLIKGYGDTDEWHLAGAEGTTAFFVREGEK